MSVFPEWEKYAVPQRRQLSGCIPTGYEMLLRAAKVPDIDFDSFQDEFDLDKGRLPHEVPQNDFESVAHRVNQKYPQIHFTRMAFPRGSGNDKLKFIEDCISRKQPILISLAMMPLGINGYHIMPVVDSTESRLVLLYYMNEDGVKTIMNLPKSELVRLHDAYDGGNDVAYLVIANS